MFALKADLPGARGTLLGLAVLGMIAIGTTGMSSCADASGAVGALSIDYGNAVTVGNGIARVYVLSRGEVPVEVGVALSEKALEGLPSGGHHDNHWLPPLPEEAALTTVRHVLLNWNPEGHEPEDIYGIPHFDFHFYQVPNEVRETIYPSHPEFLAKAARIPADELLPPGYVSTVEAVPGMGVHWIDPASPEFNGQTFTTTFIYGTWDGKLVFSEPMITRAFLLSRPDVKIPVPVPARFESEGLQAGSYIIRWDDEAREYRVALTDLVLR